MELFGATTITRKIILEGGLFVIDDGSGSGSGAAVGTNDAPLIVFEITSHYDYDHTSFTNFSPYFATSSEFSAYKCQNCKAKHKRVINAINALTTLIKEMTSKRGVIPSKRISCPYTPLDIKCAKATGEQHELKRNCGLFVAAYAWYLSNGLQVSNDRLDAGLLHKRYATLLWKYGEVKAQNPYESDIKDPQRPKSNSVAPDEEHLVHIE
ncbi:hypothetical protein CQW23_17209 [Capsicum baccatum]|uniref:Uncharacterized protein n=1 Tax=Capsicum baccatum TaxID=33114 RepID=A0A2G2WD52_CAPBA|nr:hypothetical protein CQW23_17209 [Capsicum baccatum]